MRHPAAWRLQSASLAAHLMLLGATVVWGATFLAVKSALADASPLLFNAVRMTLAAVILCAVFARRLRTLSAGALRSGIAIGTTMWLGYELQTLGLLFTSPSRSAFLSTLCVVLVPLLLAMFWRRRINRYVLAGVACAFAGLFLLCLPQPLSGSALNAPFNPAALNPAGISPAGISPAALNRGDALTLGCAVAFAFQIILVGQSVQRFSPTHIVPVEIASCALWMLLSLPVAERHGWLRPSRALLAALAFTALLGTVGCFLVQAWAQRLTPPTHAALIYSLEPVVAALLSYRYLGERLGGRGLAGAALILAGVLVSEFLGHVQLPAEELAAETG